MAYQERQEPGDWVPPSVGKLDEETLGMRAEHLERVLNGQVVPTLGLHAALVGACLLFWASAALSPVVWIVIGAGLAALGSPWPKRPQRREGLLGAAAVFASIAILSTRMQPFDAALAIGAVFGGLAGMVMLKLGTTQEFLVAPIYVVLLIEMSRDKEHDWLLFIPIMAAAAIAAVADRRARASFSVLVGFLIVLGQHDGLSVGAAVGALVAIVALFVYAIRSTRSGNSDLINFLIQGLACIVLLVTIGFFVGGDPAPWIWPTATAVFFIAIRLLDKDMGAGTAMAWVLLMFLATMWSLGEAGTVGSSAKVWPLNLTASLVSFGAAILLRLIGGQLQSAFVANVGLAVCLLVAQIENSTLLDALSRAIPAASGNTLGPLLVSIGAVLVGATLYLPVPRAKQTPWWRGLIPEAWVPLISGVLNASRRWTASVPILGWVLTFGARLLGSVRYLKRDGAMPRFGDLALLAVVGLTAWSASAWLHALMKGAISPGVTAGDPGATLADTIAFGAGAVLLYGYGLLISEPLFLFSAIPFALVPFREYIHRSTVFDPSQVGGMALALGLVLVLCAALRGLHRRALDAHAQSASLASPIGGPAPN